MISYEPLWQTMKEKKISTYTLNRKVSCTIKDSLQSKAQQTYHNCNT